VKIRFLYSRVLSASFASDCWDASSVFVRCCARQSRSLSSFCSSGEYGARLQAVVLLRARLGGLRGLLRDALNRGVALSVIADRGIQILDRLDVAAQSVHNGNRLPFSSNLVLHFLADVRQDGADRRRLRFGKRIECRGEIDLRAKRAVAIRWRWVLTDLYRVL
jgi:hypothetical protein